MPESGHRARSDIYIKQIRFCSSNFRKCQSIHADDPALLHAFCMQQCWAASCIAGSVIIQISPGKYEFLYVVGPACPALTCRGARGSCRVCSISSSRDSWLPALPTFGPERCYKAKGTGASATAEHSRVRERADTSLQQSQGRHQACGHNKPPKAAPETVPSTTPLGCEAVLCHRARSHRTNMVLSI